jgi:hypothetical protein
MRHIVINEKYSSLDKQGEHGPEAGTRFCQLQGGGHLYVFNDYLVPISSLLVHSLFSFPLHVCCDAVH